MFHIVALVNDKEKLPTKNGMSFVCVVERSCQQYFSYYLPQQELVLNTFSSKVTFIFLD